MKIKLLIASSDIDYAEHLSRVLADKFADVFQVGVCSSTDTMDELLSKNRYDVALLEAGFAASANLDAIRLPLILFDETSQAIQGQSPLRAIKKYQRISAMAGSVLESYSEFSNGAAVFGDDRAKIIAVWSPCGGVGKTTIALAYAARKVADGKHVTYLNLENFSSASAYFPKGGKSISTVFEKLEADVPMLLLGIRQQDSGSGITYYSGPDNYDDINILTVDDLSVLIQSCAVHTDEVVIDLSSQCDEKVWKIFDLADTVLLVCDSSTTSRVKTEQFFTQHNIAGRIQDKCVLVNNKNAQFTQEGISKTVSLSHVQSSDAVSVYKTLSGNAFEW